MTYLLQDNTSKEMFAILSKCQQQLAIKHAIMYLYKFIDGESLILQVRFTVDFREREKFLNKPDEYEVFTL